MAESLLVQLLLGEVPEEVKALIKKQRKAYQTRLRREVSETYRKRMNAARRQQYKTDEEFRNRIRTYRKKWWDSKTPEERREIYAKAKLNRLARAQSDTDEKVRARTEKERLRKRQKRASDPAYKEEEKNRQRARRANMSEEDKRLKRNREKAIMESLPTEERERRIQLARERNRRHREKKKMQSISNDQGQDHGTRKKHSRISPAVGDAAP